MNPRIRELAKEARQYAEWTTPQGLEWFEPFQKKFAELIVGECLDVIAMRMYLGPAEICRQECKALASEIKEHFGVEA